MRLTACVFAAVLAAATGSARADEPTTEQLAKAFVAKNKEVVELLDGVKDKAGAEKAKPKLKAISDEILKLMEALNKRPVDEEVKNKFAAEANKYRFDEAFDRLSARVPGSAGVLADVPLVRMLDEGKEARVKADAQTLIKAVKTYYTNEGRWPAHLNHVALFLENGVLGTLDPWGQPYKYEIGPTIDPKSLIRGEPYVWAERKVGEKVKVIGTKPVKKQ